MGKRLGEPQLAQGRKAEEEYAPPERPGPNPLEPSMVSRWSRAAVTFLFFTLWNYATLRFEQGLAVGGASPTAPCLHGTGVRGPAAEVQARPHPWAHPCWAAAVSVVSAMPDLPALRSLLGVQVLCLPPSIHGRQGW